MSSYTTPGHIARATLEANAFMTRAVLEAMNLDSGVDMKEMKVYFLLYCHGAPRSRSRRSTAA